MISNGNQTNNSYHLDVSGNVWSYGVSDNGQIGNNTIVASTAANPVNISTYGSFNGKTIVSIACGSVHTIALDSTGAVHAWGYNTSGVGQLGNNISYNAIYPIPIGLNGYGSLVSKTIVAIACGFQHTVVLDSTGAVHTWGLNGNGQLGNNTTMNSLVPINVGGFGSLSGKTIVAIACGGNYTMAIDSTGAVHAWGVNTIYQLGNNTMTNSAVPINVSTFGSLNGKTIVTIACGANYSMALDSTGAVHAWGYNASGQLGNNDTFYSVIPIKVGTFGSLNGKTIIAVACGASHTLALDSTGAVHTWGLNGNGQLGNNATTNSLIPINIMSVVGSSLIGKTIVAIACGANHTLALDSTGVTHTWGLNNWGQLGDGTLTQRLIPAAISTSYSPVGTAQFINFTGQHRCFVDGIAPNRLQDYTGLIVVTDKDKYFTPDGMVQGRLAITTNNSLPLVSLATSPQDKRVFGVISMTTDNTTSASLDQLTMLRNEGDTRAEINAVGEGAVWVCDEAGPLTAGDYLTTSSVAGYGMCQVDPETGVSDDIMRRYTVAKITMDCNFDPMQIEVQRIVKDAFGNPVLDSLGNYTWEPEMSEDLSSPITESAYTVRHLKVSKTVDGEVVTIIQKDDYDKRKGLSESGLYKAAFVGCTYHCG